MKKAMVITFLAICTFAVDAQKLLTDTVPSSVENGLTKAHTPTLERKDANYEARFKEAWKSVSCVPDKTGTILETKTEIAQPELPQAASTYLADHYKAKQ